MDYNPPPPKKKKKKKKNPIGPVCNGGRLIDKLNSQSCNKCIVICLKTAASVEIGNWNHKKYGDHTFKDRGSYQFDGGIIDF